jgi:hypothetical protein
VVGWFVEVSEALVVAIIRAGTKQKPETKNGKKLVQEVSNFIKLLGYCNVFNLLCFIVLNSLYCTCN